MVKFTATLDRFGKYKEKSGWTFIPISSARAQKLSSHKTAFRVKGKIDDVEINQVALVPMGDGAKDEWQNQGGDRGFQQIYYRGQGSEYDHLSSK